MYNLTASDGIVDTPTHPTQQFERLQKLAASLHASPDIESYLQALLSAAMELTGCESASILEYDRELDLLRFVAVPWFHQQALAPVSVPVDSSIAGWVVRNCAPLMIPNVSQDERHFQQADALTGFETRSILVVPLNYHDRIVGVFEALNKPKDAVFNDEDTAILEALAGLAASTLQNDLLERRVKKSLEEVNELDRMKSDFIAITSHELRTPLGLILGHGTFLREMVDPQYAEQVEAIIRNASRLKEIIDNLASVDNFQAGAARVRQHRVSMNRIAEEVAGTFEQMARRRNISLRTELGKEELLVEADGNKIAIALSNLVKNALTFTNEEGHVLIKTEAVPNFVKVSVIDDGIGIPAADLGKIFERFYQVEAHLTRRYGGMGLGLSVAKAMIEMHGGRLWAESVEGKGSTFSFLLPYERPQPSPGETPFSH